MDALVLRASMEIALAQVSKSLRQLNIPTPPLQQLVSTCIFFEEIGDLFFFFFLLLSFQNLKLILGTKLLVYIFICQDSF